jgi:hypothetical protein
MVGDYTSTSITPDYKAHSVFAVANTPGAQLDVAMYTPVPGLSLESLSRPGGKALVNRVTNDPVVFFGPSDQPLPKGFPTAR